MAQIKNIKKPGDLIRGAKVGVAGLDKDGNVVGTGIDTEDIAVYPDGAQSGDVLAWGGDTGPEWRPHYPESGSEGDVLTLGETGPEWAPPAGGSLYNHCIYARDTRISSTVNVYLEIITKSDVPFDSATLYSYFVDNGLNTGLSVKPATGYYTNGSTRVPITSISARNDGNFTFWANSSDSYAALNDINDTVIEI